MLDSTVYDAMDIKGKRHSLEGLFIPAIHRGEQYLPSDTLWVYLDALESGIEKMIHSGAVTVINCEGLNRLGARCAGIERAGVVPLRWGAPRLLLVTPEQGAILDQGDELVQAWRLWRYKFEPSTDGYIVGSPNRTEAKIAKMLG